MVSETIKYLKNFVAQISRLIKNNKKARIIFFSTFILFFSLIFLRSFIIIGLIIGLLVFIEVLSCYYLRLIPVKGWLELLSFTTIMISFKFGFQTGFWFFIGAYFLSMISRQTFYFVEFPYMIARAFILGLIPSIMADSNLMLIVIITMIAQRIVLAPILIYIAGIQLPRLVYESFLNILFTVALIPSFGNFISSII